MVSMPQALLLEPSAGDISDPNTLRSLLPRCLLASVLFSAPGWFSRTASKVVSDLAGPSVSCGARGALQKDVDSPWLLPAGGVRCANSTARSSWQGTCCCRGMQQRHIFHTDACVRPRIGPHIHKTGTAYPQGGNSFILPFLIIISSDLSFFCPWGNNAHFSRVFHSGNLKVLQNMSDFSLLPLQQGFLFSGFSFCIAGCAWRAILSFRLKHNIHIFKEKLIRA